MKLYVGLQCIAFGGLYILWPCEHAVFLLSARNEQEGTGTLEKKKGVPSPGGRDSRTKMAANRAGTSREVQARQCDPFSSLS